METGAAPHPWSAGGQRCAAALNHGFFTDRAWFSGGSWGILWSRRGDLKREDGFWWRRRGYMKISERWDFLSPLLQLFSAKIAIFNTYCQTIIYWTCSLLISTSSRITFKVFCHSFLGVTISIRASVFLSNRKLRVRVPNLRFTNRRCIPLDESDFYEVVNCEERIG